MQFYKRFFIVLLCIVFSLPVRANQSPNQVAETSIRNQISALKTGTLDSTSTDSQAQNLEATLRFVEQTKKQKQDMAALEKQISTLPQEVIAIQNRTKAYKEESDNITETDYAMLSLEALTQKQNELETALQSAQVNFVDLDTRLSNSRNLLKNNQKLLDENLARMQEINRVKNTTQSNQSLLDKWNAELTFLEENNRFNALLSSNAEKLISLDEAKRNEAVAKQQLIQKQLSILQETLNTKRLEDSQQKAQEVANQTIASSIENYLIKEELEDNQSLSQFLVQQTQKLNALSRDDLRMKNVLEGLTQTQRNIDEQISALQGTLVLSKVINKQKQALPTESFNKNLANSISNVRVHIFEYSQQRDELYNIDDYIKNITEHLEEPLTEEESQSLNKILKERQQLLDEIIKSLNSQLNISINIENNLRNSPWQLVMHCSGNSNSKVSG